MSRRLACGATNALACALLTVATGCNTLTGIGDFAPGGLDDAGQRDDTATGNDADIR